MNTESNTFANYMMSLEPDFVSGTAAPLHLFITFPEIELADLADVAANAGVAATLKPSDGKLHDLSVRLRKRGARAKLAVHNGVWTIIARSLEAPATTGEIIEKWLDNVHPKITPAFFDSKQLLDMVDQFSKLEKPPEIHVSDYVLREYPEGPTHKTWEKGKPYERAILEKQIEENNAPLDSIKFKVSADRDSFDCRISRNGHMVMYEGSITQFVSLILSPLTETAKINYNFFRYREREFKQDKVVVNEIRLTTQKEITLPLLERLGEAICDSFVGAVLHSGNPMLYVNAIDKLDGSVFDVCAYPDEIVVIPYSKASPSSLIRLYMLITEVAPMTRRPVEMRLQN
jgi:hypothetical protein